MLAYARAAFGEENTNMKCRETKYWLYSLRPNTSWPVDVVTHLQGCVKCQQVQTRLKQIDIEINRLTTVTSNTPGKAKLLEQIERTPQVAIPASPRSAWPLIRFASYLTAAAALIVLGFFLGRGEVHEQAPLDPVERERIVEVFKDRPVEIFRDRIVMVDSPGDRDLFAALLQRNARLVQAAQVRDRLEALLDMADDCRHHALTLIEQGPRDSLPLTIDLYTQLLRIGVPAQVQQAPAGIRPLLKATTRIRLGKMAEPPAAQPKAVARMLEDQRGHLQSTAREAMELVDQPVPMPVGVKKDQHSMSPAAALVQFAIGYSIETDPVAKADSCSDCVNRLMPYMMLYLAEDASPQRGDMGQQFGEMIQFGIYAPLAAMTTQEPVKDEVSRIYQNAAQTIAEMEKNMENAPQGRPRRASWSAPWKRHARGQKGGGDAPELRRPAERKRTGTLAKPARSIQEEPRSSASIVLSAAPEKLPLAVSFTQSNLVVAAPRKPRGD